MDLLFWIIVALTLVSGTGMFLLLPGERLLADSAEALGMWPDREDAAVAANLQESPRCNCNQVEITRPSTRTLDSAGCSS
jgi:hypothetical protein